MTQQTTETTTDLVTECFAEETSDDARKRKVLEYAKRASRILRAARKLSNELCVDAANDITLMSAYSWADSAGFAMYLALRDIVESNGLTYEQAKVEYVRDVGQALEAERLHRPIRLSVGTAQPSSMGPL